MNKKVILYIDTRDNKKTVVSLDFSGKKKEVSMETKLWSSQVLLPLIEKLLKDNKMNFSDITQIKVAEGPGSYTGLRVGIAVANTLSYLLKIPVNGQSNKSILPKYQ